MVFKVTFTKVALNNITRTLQFILCSFGDFLFDLWCLNATCRNVIKLQATNDNIIFQKYDTELITREVS
jgi:hypothetical protein